LDENYEVKIPKGTKLSLQEVPYFSEAFVYFHKGQTIREGGRKLRSSVTLITVSIRQTPSAKYTAAFLFERRTENSNGLREMKN